MKSDRLRLVILSITTAALLLIMPLGTAANSVPTPVNLPEEASAQLSPLIITEVQTSWASGKASKEFIELYNASDQAIDLRDWELWYLSAKASSASAPTRRITLQRTASATDPHLLQPGTYYLLASSDEADYVTYLGTQPDQIFGSTLADNGNLWLLNVYDVDTCELSVEEQLAWGDAIHGASQPAPKPSPGASLQRYIDAASEYAKLGSNIQDFGATTTPTPGRASNVPYPITATVAPTEVMMDENVKIVLRPECVPKPPEPPVEVPTNPGEEPTPTEPEAPTEPPVEVEVPTVIPNQGLSAPVISELLPNPASPLTDANDEFIELYNGNNESFDLSGYVLEVGVTTKRRYIFPEGTVLGAGAFMAFFSADTRLALSNTEGQARLLASNGELLAQTDAYNTAKDGQAWAFIDGKWQWTIAPTPNAANALKSPLVNGRVASASATKKAASKPKSTTKSSQAKKTAQKAAVSTDDDATPVAATIPLTPLHPTVLAAGGVFALLYGAYEYRRDVANKIYQFRKYRAARRAARETASRR